jgi:trehalose 6-phosphate phosphatase
MQISSFPPSGVTDSPPADARQAAAFPAAGPRTALFLDFDGTLVDIAAQPDLVVVPEGLPALLGGLSQALGGALAIVSGRPLGEIDHFLSPLILPAAAEHGAVQRLDRQSVQSHAVPDLHDVRRVALALAAEHSGLSVEIKSAAVAVHYRHAPALEKLCLGELAEAVKRTAGVELMQGKFVFEVKPSGISKGSAIQSFMSQPPFAGRAALFAGDDTTDEAGFAAVQAMGGQGMKIGEGPSLARYRCASPALLRQWLRTTSERLAA